MTHQRTDLPGMPEQRHGQRPDIDADSKTIAAIASGVAKSVLYICFTIFLCFYVSSCSLDTEVVKQCEASCSTSGNRMKAVSNTSCECTSRHESEFGDLDRDIFVLPSTTNNAP